jgi:hypothetical protein
MDMLGSQCEACYGLAIDCSQCNGTGLQPIVNPQDLGGCGPMALLREQYEEDSEFYGDALGLSSDKPSTLMSLEQKDEIPAYRRHTKSKAQVKLLKDWFATNPNPTGPQLSEYAKVASLEKDQVRNWFVNQRRPSRNSLSKKTSKARFKWKSSSKEYPKLCI